MLCKLNPKQLRNHLANYSKPLKGDWLIIAGSAAAIFFLFQTLWVFLPAGQLKIRQGNQIIGTYDLNQTKRIQIEGKIGHAIIDIQQGSVRFKQSPCNNQYCVHQGWLSRAGQVAICIPNQISLELTGKKPQYDSLNY